MIYNWYFDIRLINFNILKKMNTFLLLVFLIGLALTSDCTEKQPKNADDCLSIYSPDNICCENRIVIDGEETRSCVEKDISYSGKNEFEETLLKGIRTKKYLTCAIKVEFCGGITADEVDECLEAKIPNGLCCFDKKQGVCFGYPFHFKSDSINCEKTKKKEEEVKQVVKQEEGGKKKKRKFFFGIIE